MRCYQHRGLTKEAFDYLEKYAEKIPNQTCPNCNYVLSEKYNVLSVEHVDAFYGDGPTLRTIQLKEGGIIKEVIQAMPQSSGPVGFLCLEINGQRMFQWSEKEIEEA